MLALDLNDPESLVRAAHLTALFFCFWIVLRTDLTAGNCLFRALCDAEFKRLRRNHHLLIFGLAVFWGTGLYLIWLATGFVQEEFTPKLVAKLSVVSVLSINAVFIGRYAMPYIERNRTLTMGQLPFAVRWRLMMIGGISTASWLCALCLGAIDFFKTATPVELTTFVMGVYAIFGLVTTLMAVFAPVEGARDARRDVTYSYQTRSMSRSVGPVSRVT